MESSFTTFFRLSKHEKFTEFTRLDSLNLIRRGKIWTKWILPLLHFQKGRFGSKILEHGTSQKTLSQLAEPYHLWVLAFISQCPCTGKILTHSLVFIKLQLPSTLLECLLLFKQISLSTAPVINQTAHYARNYLSSDVPIYSSLSQIINKISWFPFRVDWCRTPQCLPFNRSLPIDFNTLSRKLIQKHISTQILADISGR